MALTSALGLMSGTSMDGIDVAAIRTDGEGLVERGPSLFVPYEVEFRTRLESALATAKSMTDRTQRPGDLAEIERDLTLRHAKAVADFLAAHESSWGQIDLIGFHGQTVLHRPQEGLTVQLGDGALLASETALPVVYDMRAADMLAGGQGAPLVPAYHAALAASLPANLRHWPIVFVNIGGISNVTFIPETGAPLAFDSGPGNQLIDQWVQRDGIAFDEGGAIAAEGSVKEEIVARYMAEAFFAKPVPKSLDRGDFRLVHMDGLSLPDGARTLANVAAHAIQAAAEHMPAKPKLWILCGGGRKNPLIVGDLKALAAADGSRVIVAEDTGLDGDATEAEAWAYLAVRSQRGLPLTWPTTTGCSGPTSGGVLAMPEFDSKKRSALGDRAA